MSRLIDALKKLAAKITAEDATISDKTLEEVIEGIASNYSVTLVSPDKSVWDLTIANDGTITGVKRT